MHLCLIDPECWQEWWEYGKPMRFHWGENNEKYVTFPGFELRSKYLWADAHVQIRIPTTVVTVTFITEMSTERFLVGNFDTEGNPLIQPLADLKGDGERISLIS